MAETTLTADTPATLIPQGQSVVLAAGTPVEVLQTLGGSVTVRTDRGLFRIAREHAAAVEGLDVAEIDAQTAAAAAAVATGGFSEEQVWAALRTCFDPEIPVNIVDLGLIYDLAHGPHAEDPSRQLVEVKMTLTAQGCGMGPVIAEDARQKIAALPGVAEARVHIVWDPVWSPQMISAEGRKALGIE